MKSIVFILTLLLGFSMVSTAQTVDTAGVVFSPSTAITPPSNNLKHHKALKPKSKSVTPKQSLWGIFIQSFMGGVLAFFMPCIFPMLPMTIAYFTKSTDRRDKALAKAFTYGASIIIIYVLLGMVITLLFGSDALNSLSTNGIFNILFFLLLIAFSASFLGAFEMVLPSAWVNATDSQSDKAGLVGIFFMAATLALVSFSCTGPIVGTLLVQAATQGALLGPIIGMFGYSLALALPFVLFALFPAWIQRLPKSGGWLNSIKVVLGFVELALSLKFLSNVDLAYHWHWFDREVYLVLWIIISALCGLYLLGKLKFSHDSELNYIPVPRLFLGIITLAFALYLVPGLWGAPLKSVSAFLPPMATQDFDMSANGYANGGSNSEKLARKYGNLFDSPKGFNPYFDYNEGLAYAKKVHKPVMIDFTGKACVNCRKMEANVWPVPEISRIINQDYVLIQLYVDDKTELPLNEQSVTSAGRSIKSIGNKWSDLQASKFISNSQPFYVLLNPESEEPLVDPTGADYDPANFLKFLQNGLKAYTKY